MNQKPFVQEVDFEFEKQGSDEANQLQTDRLLERISSKQRFVPRGITPEEWGPIRLNSQGSRDNAASNRPPVNDGNNPYRDQQKIDYSYRNKNNQQYQYRLWKNILLIQVAQDSIINQKSYEELQKKYNLPLNKNLWGNITNDYGRYPGDLNNSTDTNNWQDDSLNDSQGGQNVIVQASSGVVQGLNILRVRREWAQQQLYKQLECRRNWAKKQLRKTGLKKDNQVFNNSQDVDQLILKLYNMNDIEDQESNDYKMLQVVKLQLSNFLSKELKKFLEEKENMQNMEVFLSQQEQFKFDIQLRQAILTLYAIKFILEEPTDESQFKLLQGFEQLLGNKFMR